MERKYQPISNLPSDINKPENKTQYPPQGDQTYLPPPLPTLPYMQPQNPLTPIRVQLQPIYQPIAVQYVFKTTSVLFSCPICRNTAMTKVKKSFSCLNCCFCLCTSLLCWVCLQCCRDKDLNCCNAVHYCASCKNIVGSYKAC